MKYEFKKKFLDKGIMKFRFNMNYWFLKKLGLNGFALLGLIGSIKLYQNS